MTRGRRRSPLVFDRATSLRLSKIRQRDTAPELAVRAILCALGLRYRVRNRDLPGSPDIANRTAHWAVFVHGCYWHAHRGCSRATVPKRNREFWVAKFEANVKRDAVAVAALRRRGFRVAVVWECEIENHAERVAARLRELTGGYTRGKRDS